MADARLEGTRWPGIYRRGARYAVIYRDQDGKQRQEAARTLEEARALKRRREEGGHTLTGRLLFADYAREWVERHVARESTREDYRRHLERCVIPFIGENRKLVDVSPLLVNQLVAHLRAAEGRNGPLADSTIATILKPLRACLRQARDEGLIAHNPTHGVRVRKRETIADQDEDDVRALTARQLATFLELVPACHRLLFRFLAATGVRVSELFAVQWQHLELDGSAPRVRVRRALVRGRLEPPKTEHGRRDVPLPVAIVQDLRAWRRTTEWPRDEDLVFPTSTGKAHNYGNLRHRVLTPTAQEAGVP